MLRSIRSAAAALAGLGAATLGLPGLSFAVPCSPIVGDGILEGEVACSAFTVPANLTLTVPSPSDGGKGAYLHIIANSIVIEAGASIDASGAGYQGALSAAGMGPGGGQIAAMMGEPGGGGGLFGAGGQGTINGTCAMMGGGNGGAAYLNPTAGITTFGSAGGAAFLVACSAASVGGAGGGSIVLEAGKVQIDGTLKALGMDGQPADVAGAGAGAGGAIQIIASALSGSGTISVAGGNGLPGTKSSGGGGGGGLIVVSSNTTAKTLVFDTAGGTSGACAQATAGAGKYTQQALPGGCLDADGDGHKSTACGGDDCDDSDPAIHPGATWACGKPVLDCSNMPSDGTCPTGQTCQDLGGDGGVADGGSPWMCATPPMAEVDAGPPPDHVDFEGGCSAGAGTASGTGTLALGLIGLLANRARRRARSR